MYAPPLVQAYVHSLTTIPQNFGYRYGVYCPNLDRIYFAPSMQASATTKNWHYIDGATGNVEEYVHTFTDLPVADGYWGGVLSPSQQRIYLVPRMQFKATTKIWHYIDCATGAAVEYNHGLAGDPSTWANWAYRGGVYNPTLDRIVFVPYGISAVNAKTWHYVDCATGTIVAYVHTLTTNPVGIAYNGGVYDATQRRVYMAPHNQATVAVWHYIDGTTNDVVQYSHGLGTTPVAGAYSGAEFAVALNRIYLVP